jgi:hypothetical protein
MSDLNYMLTFFYDSELKRPINRMEIDFSKGSELTVGAKYPVPVKSDMSVEERHFKLSKNSFENHIVITNISEFGTYFKIKPCVPTFLPYGHYITIGRTWILFTACTGYCKLEFVNEAYNIFRTEHVIFGKVFIIGSSQNDSIVLADQSVSRGHLKLRVEKGFIEVMDYKHGQGSVNGTWVSFPRGEMHGNVLDLRLGIETFAKLEKIIKLSTTEDSTEKINKNAMSFLPIYKDFDPQIIEEEKKQIAHTSSIEFENNKSTKDLRSIAINLCKDEKTADELMSIYKKFTAAPSELASYAPKQNIEIIKLVFIKMGFNKIATKDYFNQLS